jgi:hypothetical protein
MAKKDRPVQPVRDSMHPTKTQLLNDCWKPSRLPTAILKSKPYWRCLVRRSGFYGYSFTDIWYKPGHQSVTREPDHWI